MFTSHIRIALVLAAVWCLFYPHNVLANTKTSNDLYRLCTDKNKNHKFLCVGYISGWLEEVFSARIRLSRNAAKDAKAATGEKLSASDRVINLLESYENIFSWRLKYFCFPAGVDSIQLGKIWVKFLEDNPENLHKRPSETLRLAFRKAFPCPDKLGN